MGADPVGATDAKVWPLSRRGGTRPGAAIANGHAVLCPSYATPQRRLERPVTVDGRGFARCGLRKTIDSVRSNFARLV